VGFLSPFREQYLETGHDRFFVQSFPSRYNAVDGVVK
jgi:hypothetical protein